MHLDLFTPVYLFEQKSVTRVYLWSLLRLGKKDSSNLRRRYILTVLLDLQAIPLEYQYFITLEQADH